MTMSWKSPEEGVIDARKEIGGRLLVIRARDVRRTGYGLQAKLAILIAPNATATSADPMHGHVFTLDNGDHRHDFANSLYGTARRPGKLPPEIVAAYPQDAFEKDLYLFSEHFHRQMLGNLKGGFVAGDRDRSVPSFLLDGYILSEGGTILYAPPKSAKSYTAMLMAVSIDAGVSRIWRVVQQRRVLYINLERGEKSMTRRLGLVNEVLGLDPERPMLMLNKRGRTLADVYEPAKEMISEHNVGLVLLDSLSRGGFGDLNGNEEANKSMDYLNRLHPAWCAIGHTPRSDDTHIFGSNMFDAAMDIGVNVRRQRLADGTLGIGLHVKDTNDTGVPPMRILAYEFDVTGLVNVRDAYTGEFPEIDGDSPESPRTAWQRIEDHMKAQRRSLSISRIAEDLDINKGTVKREIDRQLAAGTVFMVGKVGNQIMYGLATDRTLPGNVAATLGTTPHPPLGGVSPATFDATTETDEADGPF